MKALRFFLFVSAVAILGAGVVDGEELRVVTINVWAGLDYKGSLKMGEYQDRETRDRRTQILIEQLRELDPDVIALNEANKLPRYARMLARELGYDQTCHVGLGGVRAGPLGLPLNLREGDVILARKLLQLEGGGRKQLSGGPVGNFFTFHFADATQVIGARIQVVGRKVYVFNTHLDHKSQIAREKSVRLIARRIRDRGHRDPFILTGDFNADEENPVIAYLKGNHEETSPVPLKDSFRVLRPDAKRAGTGNRFEGRDDGPKIDYIFVRPDAEVLEASIIRTHKDEVYPSDHYPVTARIRFGGGGAK